MSHQFFTSNLEVWHYPGKKSITENDEFFTENQRSEFERCSNNIITKAQETKTSRPHIFENTSNHFMVTAAYRSESGDISNENEGVMVEKYHDIKDITLTPKQKNIGVQETNKKRNRQEILQAVPLTLTCPPYITDSLIPPGTVVSYIPPNLEYLDISVSKLAYPVFQFIFSENNSLTMLNASQSLLYCLEGPVRGLHKIEYLDLSENSSYNISKNFFQYGSSLKSLYINKNLLGSSIGKDDGGEIMQPLVLLEVLDISHNRIYRIPKKFFQSQYNLVSLKAFGNLLQEFEVEITHMTKLQTLDLSMNSISTLSDVTRGNLVEISSVGPRTRPQSLMVDLSLNPIHCSCDNLDFLKWVFKYSGSKSALVVNISECLFPGNQTKVRFSSHKHLGNFIDQLEKHCQSYVGLIVGLTVVVFIFVNVILGIIVHKHRWQLQYWYYVVLDNYRWRWSSCRASYEELGGAYQYDVYVASFPEGVDDQVGNQNDFVMDKLRPALRSNNIIAFYQVYNIQGNEHLIQAIGRAIHASRVVLFVFSDKWSQNDAMKIAVHMWQCDMFKRQDRNSVFGIRLSELSGEDLIEDFYCKKLLDYQSGSNPQIERTFWRECTNLIRRLGKMNTVMTDNET